MLDEIGHKLFFDELLKKSLIDLFLISEILWTQVYTCISWAFKEMINVMQGNWLPSFWEFKLKTEKLED